MLTTNTVQEFDYVAAKKLKPLYNYTLQQMREKREAEVDVTDEWIARKNDNNTK